MDRIQEQASKLWDLLFDDETAETYQNALNLTGTLLKEFAQLIWLTLISVFVFGAWFSDTTVKAGKSIRDWVDNKGVDAPVAEGKPIGETSKDLLEKGRTSVNQLLNQAREQLGLEPQALAPRPTVSSPAVPSQNASPSADAVQPAETAVPAAAQKPPAAQPSAATQKPLVQQPPVQKPPVQKPPAQTPVAADRPMPGKNDPSLDEDDDWPPKEAD